MERAGSFAFGGGMMNWLLAFLKKECFCRTDLRFPKNLAVHAATIDRELDGWASKYQ